MAGMTVTHVGAKGTPCERVRNVIRWLTASHGCLNEPAGRVQEETSKSSEERRSEVGCLVTRGRQLGDARRDALGDVSLLSLVCFSSNWHRPASFSFLLLVACLHFSVLSFFLSCVHWKPRFPCFPLSVFFFLFVLYFLPRLRLHHVRLRVLMYTILAFLVLRRSGIILCHCETRCY